MTPQKLDKNKKNIKKHKGKVEMSPEVEEIIPELTAGLNLNTDQKRVLISRLEEVVVHERRTTHSGPIPSPDTLKGYQEVLESAPERIITMAEKQQTHRHGIEDRAVKKGLLQSATGQWMGFGLAVLCILSAVYLALNDKEVTGSIIGGSTIVALCTIFVLGKRSQKKKP